MSGELSDQTYLMSEGWSSLAAELLRRMADRVPGEEVDFYDAKIRANGGAALDVACGAGRHAVPLAQRGFDVTGIDASADAIHWARIRAEAAGAAPVFHRQSMQELELPRQFGTIFIPNGSFQILTERSVARAVLERFRRQLVPGGELLIDFGSLVQSLEECMRQRDARAPWTFRSGLGPNDHGEIVARTWIEQVFRFEQRTQETREYQWLVDGNIIRTERHTLHLHYYSKHEAELLLETNGFRDIRWFADLRDAPADDGFRSIICGARAPD
jgi:2-polyprenyl-3-methyl-5-hydroxy-6-metoxy-1,4-benzoquinol methylase